MLRPLRKPRIFAKSPALPPSIKTRVEVNPFQNVTNWQSASPTSSISTSRPLYIYTLPCAEDVARELPDFHRLGSVLAGACRTKRRSGIAAEGLFQPVLYSADLASVRQGHTIYWGAIP